jgi:hypothetical protein
MFAGYINVVDGPQVARGPDVAQAWSRRIIEKEEKALSKKFFFFWNKRKKLEMKINWKDGMMQRLEMIFF